MANKHSFADHGDLRKYFAAIPNIVFKLGLNPYELALYTYIKQVTGEDRSCWKSTATIAKETGMGAGTVSKTKASLALPRAELNNKALIVITTEMQNGGNANHAITVTDIWPENMAELSRVREAKATRSRDERARSPHEGTRSGGEPKKNPVRKTLEEDKGGDFLSELKTDPVYSRLDVGVEFGKAQRWAKANNRRVTERMFVNWLNRSLNDLPLNGNGSRSYVDEEWAKAPTREQILAMRDGR